MAEIKSKWVIKKRNGNRMTYENGVYTVFIEIPQKRGNKDEYEQKEEIHISAEEMKTLTITDVMERVRQKITDVEQSKIKKIKNAKNVKETLNVFNSEEFVI